MTADEEKRVSEMLAEPWAAVVLLSQLSTAGLILALAERGSLDPERVFQFFRTLSEAMETAPGTSEPAKNSARMLREIETMARNMTTIPPGAGRA